MTSTSEQKLKLKLKVGKQGQLEVQSQPPTLRLPSFSFHTGGLLSTTSGAHGGWSVESSVGGEEQRMQEENSASLVSGLERLSVDGESATLCRHDPCTSQHSQSQHHLPQLSYQHQRYHYSSSQPSFHPPPLQVSYPPLTQYQSPIQPHGYPPPHYPPF